MYTIIQQGWIKLIKWLQDCKDLHIKKIILHKTLSFQHV